jgi:hypothetical protein
VSQIAYLGERIDGSRRFRSAIEFGIASGRRLWVVGGQRPYQSTWRGPATAGSLWPCCCVEVSLALFPTARLGSLSLVTSNPCDMWAGLQATNTPSLGDDLPPARDPGVVGRADATRVLMSPYSTSLRGDCAGEGRRS